MCILSVISEQALETATELELQELEQRLVQQDRQAVRDLQAHRDMAQLQVLHSAGASKHGVTPRHRVTPTLVAAGHKMFFAHGTRLCLDSCNGASHNSQTWMSLSYLQETFALQWNALILQGLEWQAAHEAEALSFQAEQAAAKAARQDEAMARAAEVDADRQRQLSAWSSEDSVRQVH